MLGAHEAGLNPDEINQNAFAATESAQANSSEVDSSETGEISPSPQPSTGSGSWKDRVLGLAKGVAEREGCEIYDLEMIGAGSGRVLRVFIDKVGGVVLEDCSNVSRALNLLLDVEDIVPGGAYNLEVSSPGLERPLRTPTHFERAIGSRVQVKTFDSLVNLDPALSDDVKLKLGKAKQIEGVLREYLSDAQAVVLETEIGGHALSPVLLKVPLDKIAKANTVFILETNEKKTPSKGGKKKSPKK